MATRRRCPQLEGIKLNFPVRKTGRAEQCAKKRGLAGPKENQKYTEEGENEYAPSSCSPAKRPREDDHKAHAHSSSPSNNDTFIISKRSLNISKPNLSLYQQAKQALHTAHPPRLLCRETEMADIDSFLDEHLSASKPGSLYMYGNPGTGKTACLSHLLSTKQADFKTVFLNCMSVATPSAIYRKIAEGMGCSKASSGKDRDVLLAIEATLSKKGHMWVLILDEIDQLDSKNQEVLYTIFDWPRLRNSHAILIGIANTLDLTDRVLPRLQSLSCRPTCLKFNPYSKDQIVAILEDRLKEINHNGMPVIKPVALQMCAKKIASCTGDIRKALDICRRAIEIMEAEMKHQQVLQATCDDRCNPGSPRKSPQKCAPPVKQVDLSHVLNVINHVFGSHVMTSSVCGSDNISNTLPLQEKIIVCAMLLLKKNTKGIITVGKLQDTCSRICQKREITFNQLGFFNTCSLVESKGLLTLKKNNKETRLSKVTLSADEKEVEHVLKDKTLLSSILSDTSVLTK